MQNDDSNLNGLSPLGLPYHETEKDREKRVSATREQLSKALEELKKLKESISKTEGKANLEKEVDGLQEFINNNQSTIGGLQVEIDKAKKNITKYKTAITNAENSYDNSIKKIQEIVSEQNSVLDSTNLLSEEEITRYREEFNEQKIAELDNAQEFKRQIENLRKALDLQKEELKTLTIASSLGMSAKEYLEIKSNVQSAKYKKIMKGVYTSLGLEEIASKSEKERTKEEKEKLSTAKEEVMKQIAEYRREHKDASVLDSIQVLYNLDVKMTKTGSIKSVSLNGEEIKMIKKKVSSMPAKVPDFEQKNDLGYTPDPTPEDMKGVNILTPEEIHKRFDEVRAYEEEQAKQFKLIRDEYDNVRDNEKTNRIDSETINNEGSLTQEEIYKRFDEVRAYEEEQAKQFKLIRDEFDKTRDSDKTISIEDETVNNEESLTPEEIQKRFNAVRDYKEEQAKQFKSIRDEYDKTRDSDKTIPIENESVNNEENLTSKEIKKLFDEKMKQERDNNYINGLIYDQIIKGSNSNDNNLESEVSSTISNEDSSIDTLLNTNDASDDALEVINEKNEELVNDASDDALDVINVNTDINEKNEDLTNDASDDALDVVDEVIKSNDASDDALDIINVNTDINVRSESISNDSSDDALDVIEEIIKSNEISDENQLKDETERGYVAMTPEEILQAQINIEYDKDGNKYSDYDERIRKAFNEFFEKNPDMRVSKEGETPMATLKRVSDAFYNETGLDFRIDRPGEFIPGTNILMPRHRMPHESDEEYTEFLEEYYNEVFPKNNEEVEEFVDDENLNNEVVNIEQPIVDDTNGIETVTLFESENKDEFYVRSYTAGRYELHSASNPARIGGALCYRISREDMERLVNGSDDLSNVSPYHIVTETYHRAYDNSIELVEKQEENVDEDINNNENNEVNLDEDNNNIINDNREPLRIEMNEDPLRIGMNEDPLRIGMNEDPLRIEMKNKDKVILYHETNNNDFYANEDTINNFNLGLGEKEVIDGNDYFKIPRDQAEQLIDSGNDENNNSYDVEVRDFELNKDNQNNPNPPIPDTTDDRNINDNEEIDNSVIPPIPPTDDVDSERVVLFRDVNDDSIYVTPDILSTFDVEPSEMTPVDYNDMNLFRINEDGHDKIKQACLASTDPKYEIEYKDIDLKTKEPIVDENADVINLTLFRDLDDNNQVYAPLSVLDEFDIPYGMDPVDVNGTPAFRINNRLEAKINELADKSINPKYVVDYVDVHLKKKEDEIRVPKKPKPHVEAIIQKLTEGLVIKPKDAKRYTADNIHAAKKFKNELKEGNYLYFLTSLLPKTVAFVGNCFKAVGSGLLLGARGKRVIEELKSRLNNLSEEELEVLFEEYRGHQLKTDMNNQINPIILERLRRYGMEKVTAYNNEIGNHYTQLFVLLGQIEALDKQIAKAKGDTRDTLLQTRADLVAQAAGHIREIEDIRVKADNLLSGGIHGLEEDFKAVSTKLSYVGKRFAKTNKFDNELQAKLAKYGQGLRDGMAHDDDEAIVENFMALESEYANNTEIRKVSLTGSKSVGSKYYTPLAERFDYRDDPFIRNVFSSIAIATSIYSAINAYKVHQIESQEALRDEQLTAEAVNKYNDQVMSQVHKTGADIESHRSLFNEGMKAQAHEHSLNTSGVFERGNLDKNNWSFTDQYHIDDASAHIDYNQFHDEAMSGIQNTVSGYASGALSQAQALQQMSDVANRAHAHLVDTVTQYKDICANYASNHPEFDLHAFNDSMDYLVQNSGTISAMNQGMVDVTDLASTLSSLNNSHMATLTSLPSDMYSTLMSSFATCVYAGHIAGTMNHENYNGRYGNDITAMMEDYAAEHAEEEEDTVTNTR